MDETTMRDLRHWFSLLDRDGNGKIELSEYFAFALFESFEAAGYEAGIHSLLQLYPTLFQQGKRVLKQDVVNLLMTHGFTTDAARVADEILQQAQGRDWKRAQHSAVKATTGDDLAITDHWRLLVTVAQGAVTT